MQKQNKQKRIRYLVLSDGTVFFFNKIKKAIKEHKSDKDK
jgi:hypothetical protein